VKGVRKLTDAAIGPRGRIIDVGGALHFESFMRTLVIKLANESVNRWLKIKLGLDAKDWPETHDNDPEPYTDDEAAKREAASAGEINLLIRTFRQTGGRDMELAHLNATELLDSMEI
jgi:hypothetical protein